MQRERRRGFQWDPRLPAALVLIVVALCGLPAVWNSHWMWIDDQMVVGSQLWPPDSILNQKWHAQGREFIAHGLYFKLLSLIFPLQPFWYYLTNYVTHIAVVGLAAWVVWRATKSGAATALCTLTAGLASTGPEVFLTLLKQELHMTLWLLVALLLVQRLLRPDCSWRAGTLITLAIATFLAGTLGKEELRHPDGWSGGGSDVRCTDDYTAPPDWSSPRRGCFHLDWHHCRVRGAPSVGHKQCCRWRLHRKPAGAPANACRLARA